MVGRQVDLLILNLAHSNAGLVFPFTGGAVEAVVVVRGSGHVCWDDAHYGEQVGGGGDAGYDEGQQGDVGSEHHPAQQSSSD